MLAQRITVAYGTVFAVELVLLRKQDAEHDVDLAECLRSGVCAPQSGFSADRLSASTYTTPALGCNGPVPRASAAHRSAEGRRIAGDDEACLKNAVARGILSKSNVAMLAERSESAARDLANLAQKGSPPRTIYHQLKRQFSAVARLSRFTDELFL
jgi:hypothetical protein